MAPTTDSNFSLNLVNQNDTGYHRSCIDLAYNHGLLVKGNRGYCPVTGCSDGKSSHNTNASYSEYGFYCFRCEESGNYHRLKDLLGVETIFREQPQKPRVPRKKGRAIKVASGFHELNGSSRYKEHRQNELFKFAHEIRGWSEDFAHKASSSPGVAYAIPAFKNVKCSSAGALARSSYLLPIIFALRCVRGYVRSVAYKWNGVGERPEPAQRFLSNERAGWSQEQGLISYGNIRSWVKRALEGETVFICEGATDWWAAETLTRIDRAGAAIGARSAGDLSKLTILAYEELKRKKADPSKINIVLIPDHDGNKEESHSSYRLGERKMREASEYLRGIGKIWWVDVPEDENGCGDLSDVACGAKDSAQALRDLFKTAQILHRPPVEIADAEPELVRILRQATSETLESAENLGIVVVPPSVGKTRSFLQLAAELALEGKKIVFGLPNIDLALEKKKEFEEIFPNSEIRTELYKGALKHCPLMGQGDEETKQGIQRNYAHGGRRKLCGIEYEKCPLASTCDGFCYPTLHSGVVTFCSHQMARFLVGDKPDEDTLVILDESPARLETIAVSRASLLSLIEAPVAKAWAKRHLHEGLSLKELIENLAKDFDAISEKHKGKFSLYRPLFEILQAPENTIDYQSLFDTVFGSQTKPPWGYPSPAEVRSGAKDHPDPIAWKALNSIREILKTVEDEAHIEESFKFNSVRFSPDGDGWSIEERKTIILPKAPTIILDATGENISEEWEWASKLNGKDIYWYRLDVVGDIPASAFHVQTKALQTSKLYHRTPTDLVWYERSPGAIQNSLYTPLKGRKPGVLGILTHKAVRLALEGKPAFEGRELYPQEKRIANILNELKERGWEIILGHFGLDNKGGNKFAKVDVFIRLGDPKPNLGAISMDAAFMGLDIRSLSDDRRQVEDVQGIHRSRYMVRRRAGEAPVHLIAVGEFAPSLPRVVWKPHRLKPGAHAPTIQSMDLINQLEEHCTYAGGLSVVGFLKSSDTNTPKTTLRRAVQRIARKKNWRPWTVGGWAIWAPTALDAELYYEMFEANDWTLKQKTVAGHLEQTEANPSSILNPGLQDGACSLKRRMGFGEGVRGVGGEILCEMRGEKVVFESDKYFDRNDFHQNAESIFNKELFREILPLGDPSL